MQQYQGPMSKEEQKEFAFSSGIVDFLSHTYPGYAWSANTILKQGVVLILEPTFMDQKIPFVLHLAEIIHSHKALQRKLVQVGGEILERYCLPREAITTFQANDKIKLLPRDFAGKVPFDAQGVPNFIGKQ